MSATEDIDKIESREDLIRFIGELAKESKLASDWENAELSCFLEGLAGWLADMDGYFQNQKQPVPETPTWRTFAQMLSAARFYE